jgi:hypothetical protein
MSRQAIAQSETHRCGCHGEEHAEAREHAEHEEGCACGGECGCGESGECGCGGECDCANHGEDIADERAIPVPKALALA